MKKVKARIYLFKHKGRKSSFYSGYRPAFNFGYDNNYITGKIELIDEEQFQIGTCGEVYIYFRDTSNMLSKGRTFSINEPPLQIGEGEILEIL